MTTIDACLKDALNRVSNFIAKTTGQAATPEEVADALTRYFVLQEIKEHIEMAREKNTMGRPKHSARPLKEEKDEEILRSASG